MASRIDTRWSLLGLRAPILEDRNLRVTVLPEVGGRIYSIVYKPLDREILWQNPRVPPRKTAFGSVYDDVWCGGWDENFPNDEPARIDGENYPDHGETWSGEWEWQAEGGALRLWYDAPISGLHLEKRFTLGGGLHADYRIVNPGSTPFSFLWKAHVALRAEPGWPIELPTGTAIVPAADPCPGLDFYYGTQLAEGWCALTDPASGVSARLVFDPGVCRACWVFASHGGWRRQQVAVLEPATGHPGGLVRTLQPGEALDTRVTFQLAI